MLKIVLIDDKNCKKEFNAFIKNQNGAIKVIVPTLKLSQYVQELANNINVKSVPVKKIAINTADSVYLLKPMEIIRCESNRNYTKFFLTQKREIIKYNCFIRIHKSHLINIDFIEKYMKTDGGYVVLKDNTKLPVASRKKEKLFSELDKL